MGLGGTERGGNVEDGMGWDIRLSGAIGRAGTVESSVRHEERQRERANGRRGTKEETWSFVSSE